MVDAQDDFLLAELDDFTCPISGVVMQDPVTADDNRTYERKYIEQWFKSCKTRNIPITSPWTRAVLSENLQEDTKLKQALNGKLHERCFRGRLENVSSIHQLRTIFNEIDKQREILSETLTGWQPPQLVVIGSESSGKSTLLERLVMMPIFPTHESFCTRLPVHVRLRNAAIPQAPQIEVFNTQTNKTEDGPHMISAQNGALDVSAKMQEIIAKESRSEQGVSMERIIILHIVGPHVPSIDLVDLPGLISTPPLLREHTHDLLEQFIRTHRENFFYLAVLPATMRPNTSVAIELVQKHYLEARTLGVFTRCDDLTSRRQKSFKKLMQDPPPQALGGVSLQPHGWHATMNAPISAAVRPGASNFSRLFEQAKREEEWFVEHFPELVESGRGGCAGLVRTISAIFLENVRETWGPKTLSKLEKAAQCAQIEYAALGLPALHLHSHSNTLLARSLAADTARQMLTEATPEVAQRCCVEVLSGFKDCLVAAATAPMSGTPADNITQALAERKTELLEECHRGADAWGDFWIAEGTAALRRTDSSGFVLSRFPIFLDALLQQLHDVVHREKTAIIEGMLRLLDRFLDETSPWVETETDLRARPATVMLMFDGRELAERAVVAFMRGSHVLCVLADLTAGIAEGIDTWVESCAAMRIELVSRIEQIEASKAGISKVLGLNAVIGGLQEAVVDKAAGNAKETASAKETQENVREDAEEKATKPPGAKVPAPMVNLPAGTILGADVLKDPRYVAIDLEGRILVSDNVLHQVIVFNSDGSVARRLGSKGAAADRFVCPHGIAVDRQGHIVLADRCHRILVLTADGSEARCFGSKGCAIGELDEPVGVAMDSDGHIVVADSDNHRVQVFNADGSVVRQFGTKGAAIGQLNYPCGVAVDAAGRIVVADSDNHRVQVFGGDGSVLLCFGSKGDGPGQLKYPDGVAVDGEGRFVVADTFNDRVQVFNPDGSVARIIGGEGDGVGQLRRPYGVVIDGAGRIVVAEAGNNHRVQVF